METSVIIIDRKELCLRKEILRYPKWTMERENSCVSLPYTLLGISYALISSFIRDTEHLNLLLKLLVGFLSHFRNGIFLATGN